jgi:uncharacterized protein
MALSKFSLALVLSCALRASDPDGTTPLHYAAQLGNLAGVKALLAKGVPPNAANRYGATPLLLAVESGSLETVNALIAAGADVNHTLPEGETVLMTAARTGNVPIIKTLVQHDARPETHEAFYGETALHWATVANHAGAVTALLDAGADVNVRSAELKWNRRAAGLTRLSLGQWTPLMYAARQGAMEAGKVLLARGAGVNLTDPDGVTALVLAIVNYHYDFAALLLDHQADPNLADSGGQAALFAAIDMNTLPWMFGRPELPAPSKVTASALIEQLLKRGANPNATLSAVTVQRAHTDGDFALGPGTTPFQRAAKAGDAPTMRLLLAHGADPNLAQKNNNTALMLAAGLGNRDGNMAVPTRDRGTTEEIIAAINICLENKADINARGANGDTALHHAVNRGDLDVIRHLVMRGAALAIKNDRGQTALDAARASRRGREDAAKLLAELATR